MVLGKYLAVRCLDSWDSNIKNVCLCCAFCYTSFGPSFCVLVGSRSNRTDWRVSQNLGAPVYTVNSRAPIK